MHLEIRHLRLVAAIADAGGVTRAAGRLHLTQSAVSHQLRDIESRLGTPLYARVGRRLVPTVAGERVLATARRVLAEIVRVEAEVGGADDTAPVGLLRLSTECYTCYHWLPGVLARFRAQWPRVELRIVGEATKRPLPALARGELDVAVVSRPLGGRPTSAPLPAGRRLRYATLFEDELVAITAPGHPFAARARARGYAEAADFAGEHVVLYNMRDEESTLLHEVLQPAGVTPSSVMRVELTEAIVELVKAGLGVGVLARWAVAPHLAAGTLVATRVGADGCRRQWVAVTRNHGTPVAPHVADFIAMLARDPFSAPSVTPGAPRERRLAPRPRGVTSRARGQTERSREKKER